MRSVKFKKSFARTPFFGILTVRIFSYQPMSEFLEIRGAKTHNLKNISLSIPKGKLVVFTGVSGSGKSSLAFDTIYAE